MYICIPVYLCIPVYCMYLIYVHITYACNGMWKVNTKSASTDDDHMP